MADDKFSPFVTMVHSISIAQNCPFPWGDMHPYIFCGSFGSPDPPSQTALRSNQPFFCSSPDRPTDGQIGVSWNRMCAGERYRGLAQTNGILPPGGWLKVTCRLADCTPGSAPGPTVYADVSSISVHCVLLS